jgi:hypothetical protein
VKYFREERGQRDCAGKLRNKYPLGDHMGRLTMGSGDHGDFENDRDTWEQGSGPDRTSRSYRGKGANLKGLRVCVLGMVQGCLRLGALINGLGSWEGTRDLREGEEVCDGEACVSVGEWGERIREARFGLLGFCARWDWEWCSQPYWTARG